MVAIEKKGEKFKIINMVLDFKKMELDKFSKVSVSNNQLRSSYGGMVYTGGKDIMSLDVVWDCGWTDYLVAGGGQNGMDV
jgi:hypothetical protein